MARDVRIDARQQTRQQPTLAQHLEASRTVTGQKQLERFIEQPRGRNSAQEIAQPRDRLSREGIDREIELRLEARRPQHSHRILTEPRLRVADELQRSSSNVFSTAAVVPDREI